MINPFLSLSAIGLAGSTFAPPLLSCLFRARGARGPGSNRSAELPSLEILIPAHNEENLIVATLRSIEASWREFFSRGIAPIRPKLTVGLDRCDDRTAQRVSEESASYPLSLRTIENPGSGGKWSTLGALVRASDAQWVALVDCGAQWHPWLLSDVLAWTREPDTIAVAPSYRPVERAADRSAGRSADPAERASALNRWSWWLESLLKSVESRAGGPVSVHGATVFYRRSELLGALERLGEIDPGSWLNDDVAIPLMLRYRNPDERIRYLAKTGDGGAYVSDLGVPREAGVEARRRRRMLAGNLQWILRVYLPSLSNWKVSCVASRRVFRTFWAYWVVLAAIGIGMRIASLPLVLGSLAGIVFAFRKRSFVIAFLSGLAVPLMLKRIAEGSRILWS